MTNYNRNSYDPQYPAGVRPRGGMRLLLGWVLFVFLVLLSFPALQVSHGIERDDRVVSWEQVVLFAPFAVLIPWFSLTSLSLRRLSLQFAAALLLLFSFSAYLYFLWSEWG